MRDRSELRRSCWRRTFFAAMPRCRCPGRRSFSRGRLKWIQSSAAGLDHCLTPETIASDIRRYQRLGPVCRSGGRADAGFDRWACCAVCRHFFVPSKNANSSAARRAIYRHATVGIVGLGGNGMRIAEVLRPFHTRIIATDIFTSEQPACVDELWPADELDRLLAESDIVILCVPLNAQTQGMIAAPQIARMKRRGIPHQRRSRADCRGKGPGGRPAIRPSGRRGPRCDGSRAAGRRRARCGTCPM